MENVRLLRHIQSSDQIPEPQFYHDLILLATGGVRRPGGKIEGGNTKAAEDGLENVYYALMQWQRSMGK